MTGGTLTRTLLGQETTAEDLAYDAAIGAGTAGILRGGGKILSTYLKGGDTATAAKETIAEVVEETIAAKQTFQSTTRPLGDEFIDDLVGRVNSTGQTVDDLAGRPGSFNRNVAKNKLLDSFPDDTLMQRSHLGQEPFTPEAISPEITLSGHGIWEKGIGYTKVPDNTWLNRYGPLNTIMYNDSIANRVEQGLLDPVKTYGPGDLIPNMRLFPPMNAEGTLRMVGDPVFLHPMHQQGLLLSEILQPGLGPVNWAACSVLR